MNDRDLFLIGDIPGFTPQIGRLVSMMNYARYTTLSAVEGLELDELDYLHDSSFEIKGDGSLGVEVYDFGDDAEQWFGNDVAFLLKVSSADKSRMLSCLMAGQHEADSP